MSIMKLQYADDIYDIPCAEDRNGLFHPAFQNYGRAQMTPLERKAVDLMNELDPTVLDMVNMSGLYLTIWKEIGQRAEEIRSQTEENLLKAATLSPEYNQQVKQREEIALAANSEAWESIRMSVTWLAEEVRRLGMLKKIRQITLITAS
ncbi:MAG: hypothetical protein J6A19_00010 [Oscillospiraceae bacterium]|nr:hypothetical protein [Oscillospiraceae bacterium]